MAPAWGAAGFEHGVRVHMLAALNPRYLALALYAAFNGAMVLCVMGMAHEIAAIAGSIKAVNVMAVSAEPSRVEKFKQGEVAAALAPQVPVARQVVALRVSDLPVQVMAVQLDQAETVEVRPLMAKRKTAVRFAKAGARPRKTTRGVFGDLPPIIVETALVETGSLPLGRFKKRVVVAESSRDITNRSLGVLVAMKN